MRTPLRPAVRAGLGGPVPRAPRLLPWSGSGSSGRPWGAASPRSLSLSAAVTIRRAVPRPGHRPCGRPARPGDLCPGAPRPCTAPRRASGSSTRVVSAGGVVFPRGDVLVLDQLVSCCRVGSEVTWERPGGAGSFLLTFDPLGLMCMALRFE